MSLDDRDWYREEMRRRNADVSGARRFVHPELKHLQSRRGVPRVVMFLFWLAVLGGLYLVFQYVGPNRPVRFSWPQISEHVYSNRARFIGLFGIVLAVALFRVIGVHRRRRLRADWKSAVYNPKEFRRQK